MTSSFSSVVKQVEVCFQFDTYTTCHLHDVQFDTACEPLSPCFSTKNRTSSFFAFRHLQFLFQHPYYLVLLTRRACVLLVLPLCRIFLLLYYLPRLLLHLLVFILHRMLRVSQLGPGSEDGDSLHGFVPSEWIESGSRAGGSLGEGNEVLLLCACEGQFLDCMNLCGGEARTALRHKLHRRQFEKACHRITTLLRRSQGHQHPQSPWKLCAASGSGRHSRTLSRIR